MPSCNRTDTADAERESAQTSARSLVTRELDQAAEEAELMAVQNTGPAETAGAHYLTGAASHVDDDWHQIDWPAVNETCAASKHAS